MLEAQKIQQAQQMQQQGDMSDYTKPSYYDRSMMENMNQSQQQSMTGGGQTMPSGVYDPTGMMMGATAGAQGQPQQGGAGMVPPQIKSRVPYYQQMYQKMAQKAAMPKGAVRNITIPKRIGK